MVCCWPSGRQLMLGWIDRLEVETWRRSREEGGGVQGAERGRQDPSPLATPASARAPLPLPCDSGSLLPPAAPTSMSPFSRLTASATACVVVLASEQAAATASRLTDTDRKTWETGGERAAGRASRRVRSARGAATPRNGSGGAWPGIQRPPCRRRAWPTWWRCPSQRWSSSSLPVARGARGRRVGAEAGGGGRRWRRQGGGRPSSRSCCTNVWFTVHGSWWQA